MGEPTSSRAGRSSVRLCASCDAGGSLVVRPLSVTLERLGCASGQSPWGHAARRSTKRDVSHPSESSRPSLCQADDRSGRAAAAPGGTPPATASSAIASVSASTAARPPRYCNAVHGAPGEPPAFAPQGYSCRTRPETRKARTAGHTRRLRDGCHPALPETRWWRFAARPEGGLLWVRNVPRLAWWAALTCRLRLETVVRVRGGGSGSGAGGAKVVGASGLQAGPLGGGTSVGAQVGHHGRLWPAGGRVLPGLLPAVDR